MSISVPQRRRTSAPIRTRKSDGSVTLTGTGLGTWIDADPGGNAAARPMDLVFPNCRVGDWVTVTPHALVSPGAAPTTFDVFAVVDGVPAGRFGTTAGISAWFCTASVNTVIGASASYQIVDGDLENVVAGVGTLRCRLRFSRAAGNATITSTASGGITYSWDMEGRGPFA